MGVGARARRREALATIICSSKTMSCEAHGLSLSHSYHRRRNPRKTSVEQAAPSHPPSAHHRLAQAAAEAHTLSDVSLCKCHAFAPIVRPTRRDAGLIARRHPAGPYVRGPPAACPPAHPFHQARALRGSLYQSSTCPRRIPHSQSTEWYRRLRWPQSTYRRQNRTRVAHRSWSR